MPASVRLSKNTRWYGEKNRSSDERSDRRSKLPDKQHSKVVEEAENCVELPLQCITFDLEGDLLALLLLVYRRHSQKHHINFDVIEKNKKRTKQQQNKGFLMHISRV